MGELGITWPSLGVAGASIGALIALLVWLVKRQESGRWMLTEDHNIEVARLVAEHDKAIARVEAERQASITRIREDAQRAVDTERRIAAEWRDTAQKQETVITEQATALRHSTDSNKLLDIVLRNAAAIPPKQGDNGPREGVATT